MFIAYDNVRFTISWMYLHKDTNQSEMNEAASVFGDVLIAMNYVHLHYLILTLKKTKKGWFLRGPVESSRHKNSRKYRRRAAGTPFNVYTVNIFPLCLTARLLEEQQTTFLNSGNKPTTKKKKWSSVINLAFQRNLLHTFLSENRRVIDHFIF